MSAVSATDGVAVPAPPRSPRRRGAWVGRVLPIYVFLIMVYTVIPIVFMIVFTFNKAPTGRIGFNWMGVTGYWYQHVFDIGDLTNALKTSLEVATLSSAVSVVLGVPMALALARYRYRGKTVTDVVLFTNIAAPSVVVGASLLSFFLELNIPRGFWTILIAHVAFNVAFVVIVVRARVTGLDRSLDRAAADLGATPWVAFQKVTLPLIIPGIVAGFLLAFAMSIDDLIITSFVNGNTLTFPLWVYGAVKTGIPPQVFVMGTLIFLGGVVIALGSVVYARRQPA